MTYKTESFWLSLSRGSVPPEHNFRIDLKATRDGKGWEVDYNCRDSGPRSGKKDFAATVRLPASWTADLDDLANNTSIEPLDHMIVGASKPRLGFDGDRPNSCPDHEPDWQELEDAVRAFADKSHSPHTSFILKNGQDVLAVSIDHDVSRREAAVTVTKNGVRIASRPLDLQAYKQLRAAVLETSAAPPEMRDQLRLQGVYDEPSKALLDKGNGDLVPANMMSFGLSQQTDLLAILSRLEIYELDEWVTSARSS